MFFNKKKKRLNKSVTFATTCWERDWRFLFGENDHLKQKMIDNHNFFFDQKIIIINNVKDLNKVKKRAFIIKEKGIITQFFSSEEYQKDIFLRFRY